MTRRVINDIHEDAYRIDLDDGITFGAYRAGHAKGVHTTYCQEIKPIYTAGDIMWVRETFDIVPISPDGKFTIQANYYYYKADGDKRPGGWRANWRPSIHMPKAAARIFLRVTGVRAEGLQDIDNTDAIREGATGVICNNCNYVPGNCTDCMNTGWIEPPIVNFIPLWNSTIKKKDLVLYGWDANPWVWVYTFEQCEKPEGWIA